MEPHSQLLAGRKRRRRRRRRLDRPPISAHLLLDERMKDDVGILSEDLLEDLFPPYKSAQDGQSLETIFHVAVSPWQPASLLSAQSTSWTILRVRAPPKPDTISARPHSSCQFPASAPALQSFLHNLQLIAPGKAFPRRDTPLEIRIVDVVPIGLDTIFVSLETEELRKFEDVYTKFGGGFGGDRRELGISQRKNGQQAKPKATRDLRLLEGKWRQAVHDALQSSRLIHAGDILPLPLATHPITHVSAPPAKITSCEPVSQGLVVPTTRIIVLHSDRANKVSKAPSISAAISNGIPEEDEDTSNEVFYSAAEERNVARSSSPPDEETTDDLQSEASATDQDDLSDGSEDAFSLMSSALPQASGALSAFQSATPRPGFPSFHGIATPGSLRSGISTSTARQGGTTKLFKAQGLLQKLPDDVLYPKPGPEDDEEARVYVETGMLVKIGCFSGDWVRIEAATEASANSFAPWKLGSFDLEDDEPQDFRAAKVYGLPESSTKKLQRLPSHKMLSSRKPSFFDMLGQSPTVSATAYASPILLANLGSPSQIKLSPLNSTPGHKITSSTMPPNAREVTLLKLATPLSLDRSLQPSLFTALKLHFERKRRIVRSGDVVAITIDEAFARSIFQGSDEATDEDILSKFQTESGIKRQSNTTRVAWFKIDSVIPASSENEEDTEAWGGIVYMDASNVKMVQAGSEQGRALSTLNSSWQYYFNAKRAPAMNSVGSGKLPGTASLPEVSIAPIRRRLRELVSAATSSQAIHLNLPPSAILLTSTQRQIGKTFNVQQTCEDLGLHTFIIDAYDIVTESGAGGGDVKTEGVLRARAERAISCGSQFTVIVIKHIEALNAERMTTAFKEILSESRAIIATTTDVDKIPDGIRGSFTHELEMTAPDEGERASILAAIIQSAGISTAPDVEMSSVAVKTAALVAGDLTDVVDRAVIAKQTRLEKLSESFNALHPSDDLVTTRDIELAGGPAAVSLTKADFNAAVEAARKNFADSIGAPKIPNVTWDDVGGLSNVKEAVMETIQLPLARPELFAKGMKKRSGILFYGPPGTGKTLLAKAIATEFSLNFFSVKGPELLNMYIGESEANVRRVFQRARDARPCVVFFDELDSVAPKRGNQGDSGGVMDRIVSQLLAELDGMSDGDEGGGGVFVIGATNRPDLLDQALLRPGRFDKMLYLGISDTHEKQRTILEALTRKFTLDNQLSLQRVASNLPFTYTGADLYALCSDAMLKAITRKARLVDEKVASHNKNLEPDAAPLTVAGFFDHYAGEEDVEVVVSEDDFDGARRELVPSVSYEELQHYETVRKTFEGNGKKETETQPKLAITPGPPATASPSAAVSNGNGNGSGHGNGNANGPARPSRRQSATARMKGLREKTLHSLHKKNQKSISVDGVLHDEDEDEYSIDTSHLASNGTAGQNGNGNFVVPGSRGGGKGKGKGSATPPGEFGDAAGDDDEELYT